MLTRKSRPSRELRFASKINSMMSSVCLTFAYETTNARVSSLPTIRGLRQRKNTDRQRFDFTDDFLALFRERFEQEFNLFVVVRRSRFALQLGGQVHRREIVIYRRDNNVSDDVKRWFGPIT